MTAQASPPALRALRATCWLLLASLLLLPVASAHVGGAGSVEASFAMPAWVVWAAGAVVVAISFALVAAYLADQGIEPGRRLEAPVRPPDPQALGLTPLRGLALAWLTLLAAIALWPAAGGLLPKATVWLVVWILLPILAYSLTNPWPALSPFRALAPLADRLRGGREPLAYPERWGSWPATLLLLGLIGLEVWGGWAASATGLAGLVLAYTLVTVAGMSLFGAPRWLARAEVLEALMGWWSAMAPLAREDGRWRWRWPGARLGQLAGRDASEVGLVLALLYGVTFDGFLGTGLGQATLEVLSPLGQLGAFLVTLVLGYLVFQAAFWVCIRAIQQVTGSLEAPSELAGRFAVSLVPIAVGYHLAHTAVYLLEAWPMMVAALADPLGLGWQLLPAAWTAAWSLPSAWVPALVGLQMLLIIGGHVLAVVAAHDVSFGAFPSRVQAVKSELPLTAVMIFYTMVGLWIVSLGQGVPG